MEADIAQIGGSEHRVAKCVNHHIGVGMSEQTLAMLDFHSAYPQFAPFYKTMNIKSHSHSYLASHGCIV